MAGGWWWLVRAASADSLFRLSFTPNYFSALTQKTHKSSGDKMRTLALLTLTPHPDMYLAVLMLQMVDIGFARINNEN